jgi:A/G-specific adenine glycosylase
VETEFSGTLPDTVETLNTFPGIGHATACSIAAFAFNKPVVFIETNIRRVFIHFFFGDQDLVHDREILPLVRQTLDTRDPRTWYWALMDYGSGLKQSIPNPNKKSAHYTKQSKFEGSDRQIRGMVLRSLVKNPEQDEKKFYRVISGKSRRVKRILDALVAEGFIMRNGSTISIRER